MGQTTSVPHQIDTDYPRAVVQIEREMHISFKSGTNLTHFLTRIDHIATNLDLAIDETAKNEFAAISLVKIDAESTRCLLDADVFVADADLVTSITDILKQHRRPLHRTQVARVHLKIYDRHGRRQVHVMPIIRLFARYYRLQATTTVHDMSHVRFPRRVCA